MGFRGSGDLGWRAWLKEYSLRILTLQTADPQGKQNIVPGSAPCLRGSGVWYDI